MARYQVPFTIRFYEAGPDGLATLPTLANLFQQAAGEHADTLGLSQSQLAAHGLGWVMSRLTWEIQRLPGPGENVVVETWPSSAGRGLFNRQYRLLDTHGGELVAASSTWAAFDVAIRKLGAIPPALIDKIPFENKIATTQRPRALPKVTDAEQQVMLTPRRTDLDLNGHVNNAQLVGWLLESTQDLDPSKLQLLDIQFRREVGPGDHIISLSAEIDSRRKGHQLLNKDSEIEIATGQSVWRD